MKKTFFTRTIKATAVTAVISLLPLGASAQWKLNFDRTWSYAEENSIVKGWKNISDVWYYFNSNGKMQTGWLSDEGKWYYLNDSGAMLEGWGKIGREWYYFDSSGAMKTGWIKDDGSWYYLDYESGMVTGIVSINDKIYYFDKSGRMQNSINLNQITDYEQALNRQDDGKSKPINSNVNDANVQNNTTTYASDIVVNGLPKLPQNYAVSIIGAAENKILELMNQKRTEAGLKPLVMDTRLLEIARYKSNHMIQYDYFDHTTSQGSNWTSWLKSIGYKYTITGENIAYNNYDPVVLFNQWWNSAGHRANMMNPAYNKVGIGVIKGNGKYMGTQTFTN